MMKRIASCLLSIVLITTVQSPAVYSAVKAGSACKKVGTKSTMGNITFTCIKSGKKLIWNKGVKVNSSDQRFSVVSTDNLTPKKVYDRSRQEVNDAIEKSSYTNTYLNFNIGPNQKSSSIAEEKDSLNRAARLWASIYQPKERLEILFYNFEDLDWAKNRYTQITGNQNFYSANSCTINYCGNASAGKVGSAPWIYEQGLGGSSLNKSTSAHEYTHLAQTSGDSNYWNIAPLWLVEGMAQFYGEAVGYFSFDSRLITRTEMHRQYASDFKNANQGEMKTLLSKNDSSTIINLMRSVEFPNPRHEQAITAAAYLLGSYGTEVLVAAYGHSSVEQFIKSFSNSSDWKLNFRNSFGLAVDDFYSKITPYLYEMSKEL